MKKLSLIACLLAILASPVVSAEAAPLTDRQIDVIRANCLSAQSTILQLQRSEAATRVNRGRAYESVSKLMAALNSRVALKKLNAPGLTSSTAEMEKRFSSFKDDYSAYEDSLNTIVKLPCGEQPVTFYDTLTNARDLRARVAADIDGINEMLDNYQNSIDNLRTSLGVGARTAQ
jgi:hypothetical protein